MAFLLIRLVDHETFDSYKIIWLNYSIKIDISYNLQYTYSNPCSRVRNSLYIFFILKIFNASSIPTGHLLYTYSNQCVMYVPYPQYAYSSFLKIFQYLQYTYSNPCSMYVPYPQCVYTSFLKFSIPTVYLQ